MIKCIIVDDETAAHENLIHYISCLDSLTIEKHCYNAFEAITYLKNNTVNLIFLDINMPKLSGFDFLKTLINPPKVIVTSAYQEYALEGYSLKVSDYLLKPFSLQRFVQAVNKVQEELQGNKGQTFTAEDENISFFLKDNNTIHQVFSKDILYVEACGNYCKLQLIDSVLIFHKTMHFLESLLPKDKFIRVHRSYIVAISGIISISGNRIKTQKDIIPIGSMYKKELQKRIL